MALGIIDLLEVGLVSNRFDSLLQGNDLIVAGHHGDGAELQTLGKMHRADRDTSGSGFNMLVEHLELQPRFLNRGLRPVQFTPRAHKHCNFVRFDVLRCQPGKPFSNRSDLLLRRLERFYFGRRTVENRYGAAPLLDVAVHVRDDRVKKAVRLRSYLMRGTVIDVERPRPSADIDSQRFPRERLLEDTLAQVANEKQAVAPPAADGRQKPQLSRSEILGFVHHSKLEGCPLTPAEAGGQSIKHSGGRNETAALKT